jgi:uncharacterized protein YozE (UPF0346 family)
MCQEVITNPLCPGCLQEGVQQWLVEQRQNQLTDEVSELTRSVFANSGSTFCIKCDSCMELCVYCYTKEVFHLIKRCPELIAQYLEYFNYDLEHLGWEQEARAYIDRT